MTTAKPRKSSHLFEQQRVALGRRVRLFWERLVSAIIMPDPDECDVNPPVCQDPRHRTA